MSGFLEGGLTGDPDTSVVGGGITGDSDTNLLTNEDSEWAGITGDSDTNVLNDDLKGADEFLEGDDTDLSDVAQGDVPSTTLPLWVYLGLGLVLLVVLRPYASLGAGVAN